MVVGNDKRCSHAQERGRLGSLPWRAAGLRSEILGVRCSGTFVGRDRGSSICIHTESSGLIGVPVLRRLP